MLPTIQISKLGDNGRKTVIQTLHLFDFDSHAEFDSYLQAHVNMDCVITDHWDLPRFLVIDKSVSPVVWLLKDLDDCEMIFDFIELDGFESGSQIETTIEKARESCMGHFETEKDWHEHYRDEVLCVPEEFRHLICNAALADEARQNYWYTVNGYVFAD